jgi:hypothetical protein
MHMTFWTFCRWLAASSIRKSKVSNINNIKTCWLWEHVFSCLVCPTIKVSVINLTSGKIPIKSTHACFSPTHMYTFTFADLRVDFPSCGLIKKNSQMLFLTDILTRLKILKMTSQLSHVYFQKMRVKFLKLWNLRTKSETWPNGVHLRPWNMNISCLILF